MIITRAMHTIGADPATRQARFMATIDDLVTLPEGGGSTKKGVKPTLSAAIGPM
jgi:hypothetical protein